ncbi:MAG TPA: hypothetical protein PK397_04485 [Ignavibacteriaceae bacterium]|nr:hypothetical protein [Ignavibacteriaceae bacterium]
MEQNPFTSRAIEFLNSAAAFHQKEFSCYNDLLILLPTVYSNNRETEFESIIFDAKYVLGLMRVIEKAASNPDVKNIEQIKKDLSETTKKVISALQRIIAGNEDLSKGFNGKYFVLTGEAFANFRLLLSDLERIKIYSNEMKRK